jgi:hypothetical protein
MAAQVDREQTSGALNMVFVGSHITNAYANLTNVILRIAPRRAQHAEAVLVNAHFDTVFGTPGAGAGCPTWGGCMLDMNASCDKVELLM